MSRATYGVFALGLTLLFGCGDNSSVHVCIGDVVFCSGNSFNPVAKPGPDQTVAPGVLVTLNGSDSQASSGTLQSYSWAQTSGPSVTLADANKARASFVAPVVAGGADLTFRLTVVDSANRADTGSTLVTVLAPQAVAVSRAVELFAGSLQPNLPDARGSVGDGCPSATADLAPDAAAAQLGLWLAGRSIAIAKGVDDSDPSAFLDAARVLVAELPNAGRDVAGQLESFGFMLLGTLAQERDPALRDAVSERLAGAATLEDPAGVLSGRAQVRHIDGIAVEATGDPTTSTEKAVALLLASRSHCVGSVDALDMTAAGLRVIVDTAAMAQ